MADTFKEILLYTSPNGKVKVEIFVQNETVWLTQDKIAELFGVQRPAITKHLKNIFESGELLEDVVCSILERTTQHGAIPGKTQTKEAKFYNLDAIISIGYRVNSRQATHFRIWATERLKEYIIKGFTMDDERLKTPDYTFGKDYFDGIKWDQAPFIYNHDVSKGLMKRGRSVVCYNHDVRGYNNFTPSGLFGKIILLL
jgi:hypothetical protein